MKKYTFILILFLGTLYTSAQQKKVVNYKYIIVPEKFEFLKENDQYKTSSLTKFLLKKNGFDVYLSSDNYPQEIKDNKCSALFADVINESSIFKTKVIIQLKDCYNKVVYASKIGDSREKEYEKAYQGAIRDAHKSMSEIKYMALPESQKRIERKVIEEVPAISKEIEKPVKVISNVPVSKKKERVVEAVKQVALNVLYAQAKEKGYQLINTKPEVVFLLLNTNVKEVFIIKDKNGILYKNGNSWVAEYYQNGSLMVEQYQIKF